MATQRRIGATIQLDGEKQFRSAVTQSTSALKTMKSEMKLLDAQFQGEANTLQALTAKHELLDKQLKQSQKIETETADALANAQKNYEKAGSSLNTYQENLRKAEEELEALKKSGTATDEVIEEQEAKVSELARAVSAGEKAYEKAGQNVESWSQKLNGAKLETINLSREIAENDKYMEEAAQSADGVASSIDGYGKKVKQVAEETSEGVQEMTEHMDTFFTVDKIREFADAVSDSFKQVATSAYDAAKTVDEGYDAIIQKTGATGDALLQMRESADNLYANMPVDMSKIGNAIGEVSTRWHLQGEELEKVAETAVKFSELNRTDVVQSIDSAQNMMSAFGESIENIGTAYDVMNATGQRTGVNLSTIASKVTENAAAFQELGLDMYQSIDFMGQLETSGADASTVLSGMKRALKSATEEGMSFDEALAEMEDRILNGTDSMDGLNAAYDLFGKSGAGIYTAVKSGSLSFRDLADSQKLVAESAESVARTYEATLDPWDEVTKAQHSLQESGAALAGEVLSEIAPAITALANGAKDLQKWFKSLPEPARKVVASVGALGVGAGVAVPKVLSLLKTIQAMKVAGSITQNVADLSKGISTLTKVSKSADAVSDVVEAVDGLAEASKGATAVAKVADAMDDIGDAASNTSAVATMAGGMEGLEASATSAQTAVTGLSTATQALVGVGLAVGAVYAFSQALEVVHDNIVASNTELSNMEEYTQKVLDSAQERISSTQDVLDSTQESMAEIESQRTVASPLVSELQSLLGSSELTNAQLHRMESICTELNAIYPDLGLSVNRTTGEIERNGRAIKDLEKFTEDYYETARRNAAQENYNSIVAESVSNEATINDIVEQYNTAVDKLADARQRFRDITDKNPVKGYFMGLTMPFHEVTTEIWDYSREINDLSARYEELTGHQIELAESQDYYLGILQGSEQTMADSANATDGLADANVRAETSYEKLAKKIRDVGGSLIDSDFADDEAELQQLYQTTVEAWQGFHDTFTDGLHDEMQSLGDAMTKWTGYRDAVADALKTNSQMFDQVTHNEDTTWESMTAGLDSNVEAYETWNNNVAQILGSARYQTDEAFRTMANSIMLMGTNGADYLQQFVDNVDMDVDSAIGDLGRFAELSGVQDTYAGTMANLQMATEQSMSGIAQAYDDTASEAQTSMQSLSDALAQQAQAYTDWYNNVEALTSSDRYASDASFREFANNVLSYGTAGADMLSTIVQSMDEGSTELDDAIAEYMSLKGANEKAAQAEASIQATLQSGFDQQIAVVDTAAGQLQTAFNNAASAGETGFTEGIDLMAIVNGEMTAAEQAIADGTSGITDETTAMTESMKQAVTDGTSEMLASATLLMSSFVGEAFGMGSQAGRAFASGIASSLRSQGSNAYVAPGQTATAPAGNATNISMTVNGTEGQDVRTLADIVLDRISSAVASTGAAYGY